ncbi:MAG: hypothetical protein H6689_01110 [Erysipelotrichaceae bacterium]|nr:hypothetical protein [Erysipelotrichaceae bacterium]MCB9500067.1 hypothetical protein [Erysipelotrichaceae bacterium]
MSKKLTSILDIISLCLLVAGIILGFILPAISVGATGDASLGKLMVDYNSKSDGRVTFILVIGILCFVVNAIEIILANVSKLNFKFKAEVQIFTGIIEIVFLCVYAFLIPSFYDSSIGFGVICLALLSLLSGGLLIFNGCFHIVNLRLDSKTIKFIGGSLLCGLVALISNIFPIVNGVTGYYPIFRMVDFDGTGSAKSNGIIVAILFVIVGIALTLSALAVNEYKKNSYSIYVLFILASVFYFTSSVVFFCGYPIALDILKKGFITNFTNRFYGYGNIVTGFTALGAAVLTGYYGIVNKPAEQY